MEAFRPVSPVSIPYYLLILHTEKQRVYLFLRHDRPQFSHEFFVIERNIYGRRIAAGRFEDTIRIFLRVQRKLHHPDILHQADPISPINNVLTFCDHAALDQTVVH